MGCCSPRLTQHPRHSPTIAVAPTYAEHTTAYALRRAWVNIMMEDEEEVEYDRDAGKVTEEEEDEEEEG